MKARDTLVKHIHELGKMNITVDQIVFNLSYWTQLKEESNKAYKFPIEGTFYEKPYYVSNIKEGYRLFKGGEQITYGYLQ